MSDVLVAESLDVPQELDFLLEEDSLEPAQNTGNTLGMTATSEVWITELDETDAVEPEAESGEPLEVLRNGRLRSWLAIGVATATLLSVTSCERGRDFSHYDSNDGTELANGTSTTSTTAPPQGGDVVTAPTTQPTPETTTTLAPPVTYPKVEVAVDANLNSDSIKESITGNEGVFSDAQVANWIKYIDSQPDTNAINAVLYDAFQTVGITMQPIDSQFPGEAEFQPQPFTYEDVQNASKNLLRQMTWLPASFIKASGVTSLRLREGNVHQASDEPGVFKPIAAGDYDRDRR